MKFTGIMILGALVLSSTHSFADDEGRWCSRPMGAHSQQLIETKSEVSADCDGDLSGQVLNDTPLKGITVRLRQDSADSKERYVTFTPKNLTVEETDVQLQGGGLALKAQLDEYLKSKNMKLSPQVGFIDVVAIKIPASAKFYDDLSATKQVSPKPAKTLQLDPKKPFESAVTKRVTLSLLPTASSLITTPPTKNTLTNII